MTAAAPDLATAAICDAPPQTLVDAIAAALGPFVLLDASFPRAGLAPEAVQVLRHARSDLERDFLLRFRQAGGHQPIVAIEPQSEGFLWPPPQFQRGDRPRAIIVAFDNPAEAIEQGPMFLDHDSAVILPASSDLGAAFADKPVWWLRPQEGGPVLALVLPAESGGAGHARMSRDLTFRAHAATNLIEARSLIHDGGYTSEGDAKYSWLWTGPSAHFRLIVPRAVTGPPRLAEICVARTEEAGNLDRLAVQLNGRPVPFELDRWSDSSGKIRVALPHGAEASILTLVVPHLRVDENSGRVLGLCIDKVILSP